jgi:hypothetical protein
MSPLNAAICTTTYLERQKCYGPDKKILFKKQLFDLKVKGQGQTKVITVRDTPPYGHAPTYQIFENVHTCIFLFLLFLCYCLRYEVSSVVVIMSPLRTKKMLWPGQENTI